MQTINRMSIIKHNFLLRFLLLVLSSCSVAQANCDWPAWQNFKQDYINEQGRVIDPSSPEKITTSEGQSYGLFFALVANDKAMFDQLAKWTENNLAEGDLTIHLPAWLWGNNSDGSWTVLDKSSASDSDLWIAYSLLEAGRLWQDEHYQKVGQALLANITATEVIEIPGFGYSLLPGNYGFTHADYWKLNPSYQPPQLLARFSQENSVWLQIYDNNYRFLLESAPKGFAPNWILRHKNHSWSYDKQVHDLGSYDAIRVYLWIGMLADDDLHKAALLHHFKPMADWVENKGYPPEKVATSTGKATGYGNAGFSAALLPFLQKPEVLEQQRQRVLDNQPGADAYYSSVLALFGQGWDQHRFRFNALGQLLPNWSNECVIAK